jgi:AraC-like DNA-binding protein
MPGGGTRTFLDPDHYEASLRDAQIEAIVVSRTQFGARRTQFRARLTWAELHHLQTLRCEEDSPRVAYMRLARRLAFVTIPINSAPLPVWRGVELQAGDIVFHSRGERLHQLARGPFVWNVIAIDPAQLEHDARALIAKSVAPPLEGQLLRPSRRNMARLQRLHAQVCRLAETNSKMLSHPEVARAIEQDLMHALVNCLTTISARSDGFSGRHQTYTMLRFEEILAENLSHAPSMSELCGRVGVSERTLRSCCAEFLGMSPIRYVLLRRLREVHSALRDADPDTVNVAEVAHRFGFAQFGRFARAYRAIFGETPSTTLQSTPGARFTAF